MVNSLIKPLIHLSKTDAKIAGGKGVALGEMIKAKFPVPEGFVILSDAFDRFITDAGLADFINTALNKVIIEDIQTIENASEQIQRLILFNEISEEIKLEIKKFYKKLGAKFVAVRSSATVEDTCFASWAGQLDSFLNTTEETLLINVKKCWSSLFTPRAIFYRLERKLANQKYSVAVIIQKMTQSEKSGVVFTVHPISQDENKIVIEAGFGLGEAIVNGSITPDCYVVDKQNFSITTINVNYKTKGLYQNDKIGNVWRDLGEEGKKQVLNNQEIIELSRLAVRVEKHFGFPCDIEWAKKNGSLYILQSRPITTLLNKVDSTNKINWFIFGQKKGALLAREIGFKHCYDEKNTLAIKYFSYTVNNYKYINWNHYLDKKEYDKNVFSILKEAKRIKSVLPLKSQSDYQFQKIIKLYRECKTNNITNLLNSFSNFVLYDGNIASFIPAGNLIVRVLGDETIKILNKYFPNDTKEQIIQKGTILGFNEAETEYHLRKKLILKSLIEGNIERCYEIWNSYKWMNIMFLTYLDTNQQDFEKEIQSIENPNQELEKIEKQIKTNFNKRKRLVNKMNLNDDEKLIINLLKESTLVEYDIIKNYQKSQYEALPLLNALARVLNISYNMLIYLTIEEILDGLLTNKIPSKEEIEDRIKNGYSIIRINKKTEVIFSTPNQNLKRDEMVITGFGCSKGRVKGTAKVILDISEITKLEKNDILITTMTTPNFVIAIKKAKAIVTNDGGITCHAAIVSRELEIPCVIGTRNATDVLSDLDFIEVDANKGIVRKLIEVK